MGEAELASRAEEYGWLDAALIALGVHNPTGMDESEFDAMSDGYIDTRPTLQMIEKVFWDDERVFEINSPLDEKLEAIFVAAWMMGAAFTRAALAPDAETKGGVE